MATKRRLIHFKTFDNFNQMKLSANDDNTQYTVGINGSVTSGTDVDVPYQAIAFIKDTEQIWTHGKLYNNTQIIDLGTMTLGEDSYTITESGNTIYNNLKKQQGNIIFKYLDETGTKYSPVNVTYQSSGTILCNWVDTGRDAQFVLNVTSDFQIITGFSRYATMQLIQHTTQMATTALSATQTNATNIKKVQDSLEKLLAMDNVYAIDFASINTILDDLPSEDTGDYNYETWGNGELLVNPQGANRTATYVILYDTEYLNGITPVWTEYISDTQIKVSFISDKHDRILFISFYVNPTTNTAWGLQLKQVYEGKETIILDLGTITENYESKSFTCTGNINSIRSALRQSIDNYGHMDAFAKYTSNGASTYCPLKVENPRTGYYTLLWQSSDYTYSLGITDSNTYNGILKLSSKVGTNLYLSGNTLSLRNSSNIALSSVNLPSQNTTKDLTSNWDGTLNFNDYDYAYAALTSSKVIRSITGPRGHYQVTLSVGSYSNITLNAIQTGNIRYFKNGIRIPSESYFTFNAHQTIILDITIDSAVIVNVITIGENSPLLPTSQYTTATQDMVFFRTSPNITDIANIDSLVSNMSRGVCTLVFNNGSGYDINATGSNWKVFLNGMEEAFPVTLKAGLHIVKVTKWNNDTARVEITG